MRVREDIGVHAELIAMSFLAQRPKKVEALPKEATGLTRYPSIPG